MSRSFPALVTGLLALGAVNAGAVVIDFESLAQPNAGVYFIGSTYSEDSFTISQFPGPQDFELGFFGLADQRFPGSTALFNNFVGGGIQLAPTGGGIFSIRSVDLANLIAEGPVSLTFVGTREDLSTIEQTFVFDSFQSLTTFEFDDFTNLITLDWAQGEEGPFHQFDNLVVEPAAAVPEPASLLLVGSGLLALALRSRTRDVL